jgi:hypothetical protein
MIDQPRRMLAHECVIDIKVLVKSRSRRRHHARPSHLHLATPAFSHKKAQETQK